MRCGAASCGMLRRFCRIPQDAVPHRNACGVNELLVLDFHQANTRRTTAEMRMLLSPYTLRLLRLAMLSFACHLVVTADASAVSVRHDTIRIGYFMSTDPYRAAAINLAIDRARAEGILSQYNIRSVCFTTERQHNLSLSTF